MLGAVRALQRPAVASLASQQATEGHAGKVLELGDQGSARAEGELRVHLGDRGTVDLCPADVVMVQVCEDDVGDPSPGGHLRGEVLEQCPSMPPEERRGRVGRDGTDAKVDEHDSLA